MIKLFFLSLCLWSAPVGEDPVKDFVTSVRAASLWEAEFLAAGWEGKLVLQGNSFYLEMDEFSVYCNGTQKWYYQAGLGEVTPVEHNPASQDLMENPAAFLRCLDTQYTQSEPVITSNGYQITLTPKQATVFSTAVLGFHAQTHQLTSIHCTLEDGSPLFIQVLCYHALGEDAPSGGIEVIGTVPQILQKANR